MARRFHKGRGAWVCGACETTKSCEYEDCEKPAQVGKYCFMHHKRKKRGSRMWQEKMHDGNGLTPEIRYVREMIAAGWGRERIAKALGVTVSAARRKMEKYGKPVVPCNPQEGSEKIASSGETNDLQAA